MKKWIPFISVLMTLSVLIWACQPHVNSPSEAIDPALNHPDLYPYLYPLYIDNTDSNWKFKRLIKSISTGDSTKLVFQFFFTKNGQLTMGVYSGLKNHSAKFYDSLEMKLKILDTCHSYISIANTAVYLGDLELDSEAYKLKELKKDAEDPQKRYIVFIPSLDSAGPKSRKWIRYTIYTMDSLKPAYFCDSNAMGSSGVTGVSSTGIITNPSPPHKGN